MKNVLPNCCWIVKTNACQSITKSAIVPQDVFHVGNTEEFSINPNFHAGYLSRSWIILVRQMERESQKPAFVVSHNSSLDTRNKLGNHAF